MSATPTAFNDLDVPEQIKMARECHALLDRLREQAKIDPSRSAVISIVAKHFNQSQADAFELIEFTKVELGEVEKDYIETTQHVKLDDDGNIIDPFTQLEL